MFQIISDHFCHQNLKRKKYPIWFMQLNLVGLKPPRKRLVWLEEKALLCYFIVFFARKKKSKSRKRDQNSICYGKPIRIRRKCEEYMIMFLHPNVIYQVSKFFYLFILYIFYLVKNNEIKKNRSRNYGIQY